MTKGIPVNKIIFSSHENFMLLVDIATFMVVVNNKLI